MNLKALKHLEKGPSIGIAYRYNVVGYLDPLFFNMVYFINSDHERAWHPNEFIIRQQFFQFSEI